jgi:hypothetical protein
MCEQGLLFPALVVMSAVVVVKMQLRLVGEGYWSTLSCAQAAAAASRTPALLMHGLNDNIVFPGHAHRILAGCPPRARAPPLAAPSRVPPLATSLTCLTCEGRSVVHKGGLVLSCSWALSSVGYRPSRIRKQSPCLPPNLHTLTSSPCSLLARS